MTKARIDQLLVENGLAKDIKEATALIMAGRVLVNTERIDKPGTKVSLQSEISLKGGKEYVGRGALKLEGALKTFGVDVRDKTCADVGACTGGFTEILLKYKAKRVYSIDVAYGELDWKLRQDKRVVNMERTNVRNLDHLPEKVDLVTIDLSFISLRLVIPTIINWLELGGNIIALIKPQFEAKRSEVESGGVVTDPIIHQKVVSEFLEWCEVKKCSVKQIMKSPIEGMSGNKEFLVLISNSCDLKIERTNLLEGLFS